MPSAKELFVTAAVSASLALIVVLVLHLVGLGEHAPIAAGVSAAVSAAIIGSDYPHRDKDDEKADPTPGGWPAD